MKKHQPLEKKGRYKTRDKNTKVILKKFIIILPKTEKNRLYLNSKELISSITDKKILFFHSKGEIHLKPGVVLSYSGEKGILNHNINHLTLQDNVSLAGQNIKTKSGKLLYKIKENEIHFSRGVQSQNVSWRGDTVAIQSDLAVNKPLLKKTKYMGNVKGKLQRRQKYQSNLDFKGDRLHLDSENYYIKIENNVEIKKRGLTASAKWGEVFLRRDDKRFKHFILYDNIALNETVRGKTGKTYQRKAYAQQLEGSMEEDLVILTGRPSVIQFNDVIKGNRIILRGDNQAIEVDDASTDFFLR